MEFIEDYSFNWKLFVCPTRKSRFKFSATNQKHKDLSKGPSDADPKLTLCSP
jgi:hypothetical protein